MQFCSCRVNDTNAGNAATAVAALQQAAILLCDTNKNVAQHIIHVWRASEWTEQKKKQLMRSRYWNVLVSQSIYECVSHIRFGRNLNRKKIALETFCSRTI